MRALPLLVLGCSSCFDFRSLREREPLDLSVELPDMSIPADLGTADLGVVAACPAPLTGGTHLMTALFPGLPSQIALSGLNLSGFFESEVTDNLEPRAWKSISWATQRPYGKPLPDARAVETGYAAANCNMSSNRLLLHFDEAFSASTFVDTSGGNHDAMCVSGPSCPVAGVPGRFRRSARFGVDDTLQIGSHADLESDQFTVETWVRVQGVPAGNAGALVAKGNQMNSPYCSFALEIEHPTANADASLHNRPRCYIGARAPTDMTTFQEVTVHGTTPLPDGSGWHHLACTFDGNALRIFVDGFEEGFRLLVQDSTPVYGLMSNLLYLGSFGGGSQFFTGELDEVAIFDMPLPPATINQHYRRGGSRLGLQVRACDEPTCTGVPFHGPNAQPNTYYTESCAPQFINPPSLDLNHIDCDGDGLPDDSPASAVAPSRYLQFRVQLDADRFLNTPDLRGVSICP